MADYISGSGPRRTRYYLGIAAVGLVIILGLLAFGGGEPGTAPSPVPEPAPVSEPDSIAPAAPEVPAPAPAD